MTAEHDERAVPARVILAFDHCDASVDVTVPFPEPVVAMSELARRFRPGCPICRAPMPYVGFMFESADDGSRHLNPDGDVSDGVPES